MHFAKSAVLSALVDGLKSVKLCQAYILISIYGMPTHHWEEDHSQLYTGLAIQYASFFQHEVWLMVKSNVVTMLELWPIWISISCPQRS